MGSDLYLRYILSLLFVLGLIVACLWALRRFGTPGGIGGRGPRRLGLVETLPIDQRRRLVLVRRDGVEHLLLLGPTQDLVVETGTIAPPPTPPFETHLAPDEQP